MPQVFLTADWHLGEERFELMQRPFKDTTEYADVLIQRHNSRVGKDDFVYVIGDALYQKADPAIWLPAIGEMKGRKLLIRGNHDKSFSDGQFAPYFDQIVEDGGGIDIDFGDLPCYLTHYPTQGKPDRFNLVGHIHGIWKFQLNSLNVGVDVHHFYPVDAKELPFFFKAIGQYYDEDAWAAYHPINADYRATRGKKSTYFQKG